MNGKTVLSSEAFRIDAQEWCRQIEVFINEVFGRSNRDGIAIAISGGLDSSVVAALCAQAIGKEKVTGLMLPERLGNPEADRYGRLISRHLVIRTMKINISPVLRGLGTSNLFLSAISGRETCKGIVNKFLQKRGQTADKLYFDTLKGESDTKSRKLISEVSSKQRVRLLITYKVAEENNLLVAGSAHKTEQMVGLFVKYGIDDGADIMPLKNIYRSQILQLAEFLDIPGEIMQRSPNPDILPGITDKYIDYFGMDYQLIELLLLGFEIRMAVDEIAEHLGIDTSAVSRMQEIIRLSEHYRSHALAPVLK